MLFGYCDIDFDPMISTYKLETDIPKINFFRSMQSQNSIHRHAPVTSLYEPGLGDGSAHGMNFFKSRFSKIRALQTNIQTDVTENITMPHSQIVKNINCYKHYKFLVKSWLQ